MRAAMGARVGAGGGHGAAQGREQRQQQNIRLHLCFDFPYSRAFLGVGACLMQAWGLGLPVKFRRLKVQKNRGCSLDVISSRTRHMRSWFVD